LYETDLTTANTQTALFDNRTVNGYDINEEIIQYAQSDTSKGTPLTFPLQNTNLDLTVTDSDKPYVLEIRVFLKNVLMQHVIEEGDKDNSTSAKPLTFISPSDWSADHDHTDPATAFLNGGNLLITARIYEPSTVGSISVTVTDGVPATTTYFVAIPVGTTFDQTTELPYASTNGAAITGIIENLPPGDYQIFKTCDNSANGTITSDGFPESISGQCGGDQTVTSGQQKVLTGVSCAC